MGYYLEGSVQNVEQQHAELISQSGWQGCYRILIHLSSNRIGAQNNASV
jgi:hypothetical protein